MKTCHIRLHIFTSTNLPIIFWSPSGVGLVGAPNHMFLFLTEAQHLINSRKISHTHMAQSSSSCHVLVQFSSWLNGCWQDGAAAEASNRVQTSCSPLWKTEVNERENDIWLCETLQFTPDHRKSSCSSESSEQTQNWRVRTIQGVCNVNSSVWWMITVQRDDAVWWGGILTLI